MKAIMYHYVRESDVSLPWFRYLHIDDFRRQLDHFSDTYGFISKSEFLEAIETGQPVREGVLLTFDDGLKDHYRYVFPELERRGVPGVFYVPAGPHITGTLLDVHRVHLLLGRFGGQKIHDALSRQLKPEMLSHTHVREFTEQTYRNQTNDEWTTSVKRTLNFLIDYRFRTAILDDLMEMFDDELELTRDFYLNESEIREMHEAGMIIGNHTVNHPTMSKLTVEEQRSEIDGCFTWLEGSIGRLEPRSFCYPYGGFHSFTSDTERMLEEAGCAFSFNVEGRDIDASDLNHRKQALPRYDCNIFPYGAHR